MKNARRLASTAAAIQAYVKAKEKWSAPVRMYRYFFAPVSSSSSRILASAAMCRANTSMIGLWAGEDQLLLPHGSAGRVQGLGAVDLDGLRLVVPLGRPALVLVEEVHGHPAAVLPGEL